MEPFDTLLEQLAAFIDTQDQDTRLFFVHRHEYFCTVAEPSATLA
jgi:hypothetical protein